MNVLVALASSPVFYAVSSAVLLALGGVVFSPLRSTLVWHVTRLSKGDLEPPKPQPWPLWFLSAPLLVLGVIFGAFAKYGFPEQIPAADLVGAEITEPTEGETVPRSLIVRGRSVHAGDRVLTVYVYATEQQRFYVQGRAAVGADGQWSAPVLLGDTEANSNEAPFQIGVLAYEGPMESEYTGLPGEPLDRVTVIRARVPESSVGGVGGGSP